MYKRVLLKLSGESLGGPSGKGLDESRLAKYAEEVVSAVRAGHQVAIVNGGGNIFRGLQGAGKGFDRVDGDKMGMLATVINSLALCQFIRALGVRAEVFTATPMEPVARYYVRDAALRLMEEGGVALIAGGTGNPFFTTDSGAALRALELKADALLKLYDKKTRTLKITKAIGDNRVRAGSMVLVNLNLGDVSVKNFMLVEKCKHTYKEGEHWMDLTLRGGEFVG